MTVEERRHGMRHAGGLVASEIITPQRLDCLGWGERTRTSAGWCGEYSVAPVEILQDAPASVSGDHADPGTELITSPAALVNRW
jgi:hypothetical protein